MKSRKTILFITILVILTSIAAFLHLSTREQIPENSLKITYNEEEIYVDVDKLELRQVTGVRVNGKGEEKPVDEQGILMNNLFTQEKITDYTSVSVVADDSYSATVTKDEVNEDEKVFLICVDDELRLIVFGDKNSKRSVSNVVEIIIE